MGQTIELNELLTKLKELKNEKKVVVTTNGCFDILHVGHVRYLNQAKALGDILVVCLNTDKSVKRLKGDSRPVNTENDRAEVLAGLSSVDFIIFFDEETPSDLLGKIKPDIHVKGGDYNVDTLPEAKVIQQAGGKIMFLPFVEGKSTTAIINKINS
ncbi:MAG: D-glycero-beta-D-manno-heptose 1-phosphate adenylyltransferase [Candidatus Gastranaerophilales bacterium]|nr:D-glycero-beta-D-manno-heptose 1-phosphate adenylyltransferase [Candidatus Gastranaerophilales bacterium]